MKSPENHSEDITGEKEIEDDIISTS